MLARPSKRLSLFVLALAPLFIAIVVSTAPANTVTYSITSIPNANSVVYADNNNASLTDTLSGTITVSSTQSIFGTWNSTNVGTMPSISLTYDLSMSNANVSDDHITGSQSLTTLINSGDIQGGGLTLTSTGMFMPNPNVSGGQVSFESSPGGPPPYPVVSVTWNGNLSAWATMDNLSGQNIQILALTYTNPSVSSLYGSGTTWQIAAAVPEPSSIALGGMALAALAFYWRKRH